MDGEEFIFHFFFFFKSDITIASFLHAISIYPFFLSNKIKGGAKGLIFLD